MNTDSPIKLNLGCAKDVKDGWYNVDLHFKHPNVINEDISKISFVKPNTVDEILAKDIIEHLPLQKSIECLNTWYSWLKPNGKIFIQTTNFDLFVQAYEHGVWTDLNVLNYMLFAGINYTDVGQQDCDFHKSVYSKNGIVKILNDIGYTITEVREDSIDKMLLLNKYSHNLNLYIHAKK